jgi:hypothetical protein
MGGHMEHRSDMDLPKGTSRAKHRVSHARPPFLTEIRYHQSNFRH